MLSIQFPFSDSVQFEASKTLHRIGDSGCIHRYIPDIWHVHDTSRTSRRASILLVPQPMKQSPGLTSARVNDLRRTWWLMLPQISTTAKYFRYGVVANISRSHNLRDQVPRSPGFDSLYRSFFLQPVGITTLVVSTFFLQSSLSAGG